MKPYYQDKYATIYHGDCLELLPDMTMVDLVLTDPPYGINYNGMNQNKSWSGQKKPFDKIIGDEIKFNPTPFIKFDNVILWGANYYSDKLPVGGWIVWDKRLDEKKDRMIGAPVEFAWKKGNPTSDIFRILHGGVINSDSSNGNNSKRLHSTQKPVSLMKRCIDLFEIVNLIFDPFMGSGTTLVAAKQLNRQAIGIEIEEKYCEISAKRLSQEVLDLG